MTSSERPEALETVDTTTVEEETANTEAASHRSTPAFTEDVSSFAVEPLIDENLSSLTLSGEIDARAQPELDRVLERVIEAQSKLLLLDVSKADFVSTAAMLSVVTAARHVGRVLIYRPNCATRRIFRLIDPAGLCQSIA